jgi:hypothetical protein
MDVNLSSVSSPVSRRREEGAAVSSVRFETTFFKLKLEEKETMTFTIVFLLSFSTLLLVLYVP